MERLRGGGAALSDPEWWARVLRPPSEPTERPTPRVTLLSAADLGPVTRQHPLVCLTHAPRQRVMLIMGEPV